MKESVQLVVFTLNEQRYGLRLSAVERVVRAVEVTLLPSAPEIVLGIINLAGRVVPVMNVRQRFGLPEKESDLSDQFIIARTAMRTVALLVDSVSTLVEASAEGCRPRGKDFAPDGLCGRRGKARGRDDSHS